MSAATGVLGSVEAPSAEPGRRGRAATIRRHPVGATFVLGCVVTALDWWWVAGHRRMGGFGIDESGFIAAAMRLHRVLDQDGPLAFLRAVLKVSGSPLLPAASAVLMWPFGPSTTTALMVQGLLHVVAATAVAAIVARVAERGAALVAGLVVLGLPVWILSARLYQLSTGVSAFLALAVLALLASDRGRRSWWMLAFGGATGAMLLSRTMSVAFLPGIALACVVVLDRSRRTLANVAVAAAGAAAVAGPWWVAQFGDIQRYLFSFGYGKGSGEIEGVPLLLRPPVRMGLLLTDVRPLLLLPAAAVLLGVLPRVLRRVRSGGPRPRDDLERAVLAIVVVVGAGGAALLSSSNLGSWFQMPLEVLAVAAVCVVGSLAPWPVRRWAIGAAVVVVVLNVALISRWTPGADIGTGGGSLSMALFGGAETSQAIDFADLDPRFRADASDAERASAERSWDRALVAVARAVDSARPTGEPVLQSVVGESKLLRSTTLELVEETTGIARTAIDAPARPEAMSVGEEFLSPRSGVRRRILIFVSSPRESQTDADEVRRLAAHARERGWHWLQRVDLPAGGTADVYVHPANLPPVGVR